MSADEIQNQEPSSSLQTHQDLVFVALGGLGEIGMNVALYGFGPPANREWLMVDLGLTFGGEDVPGVDLVMPDLSALKSLRGRIVGLVITHAHEDHIGAVAELWPQLRCPLYVTRFAAGLLEARRLSEPGSVVPDMRIIAQGQRYQIGAFDVECVPVAHSIPESCALALHTPHGIVLHTGDWKIDKTPLVGLPTDEARLRELGEQGVIAMVCDSTNVLREGISASEADVAVTLTKLIGEAEGRVIVTTFASNVARIRAVAEAAAATGRKLIVMGRAMERVIAVAQDCGYLNDLPEFLSQDMWDSLPRDRVVALATGSQGEPRAMMAKLARKEHPRIDLASGDTVIFSSRTIPGNEKAVSAVINGLILQNINVITSQTELVHVSGHPRRGELEQMYGWVRPQLVIPAHGEPLHLAEHARFAKAQGVKTVVTAKNGELVQLNGQQAGIIAKVGVGRRYKDGEILLPSNDRAVDERRKLAFSGVISIGLALTAKGDFVGTPDVAIMGLPLKDSKGAPLDALIEGVLEQLLETLPRPLKRDPDKVIEAVEKAVRGALNSVWGKKPTVHVLVVEI